MPYLTTISKDNTPIVLVDETKGLIQGIDSLSYSGYTSGTSERSDRTDRDAPRTSGSGYVGSGVDFSGIQKSGIGGIPDKYTDPVIYVPSGYGGGIDFTAEIPKGFGTGIGNGYVSGANPGPSAGAGGGSVGTPDKNGYIWTLPNGQAFPPTRIILFSNSKRTYYYEDKNLTTKFQVIGKTIEQCSREAGVQVGEFTGKYQFNDIDAFGKGLTLRSLEVKTKFPFDRLGNPVETEYTLWVDTFVSYQVDNGFVGYPDNVSAGGNASYNTGNGGSATGAAVQKNGNVILLIAGIGLLVAASSGGKRKGK